MSTTRGDARRQRAVKDGTPKAERFPAVSTPPSPPRTRRRVGLSVIARALVALLMLVVVAGPTATAWSSPGTASARRKEPVPSTPAVQGSREALRRAQERMRALNVEISLAAARFHNATVLLATVRGDLAAARARSTRADVRAASAASHLDQMARWAYEHGESSQINAVLGLGSLADVAQGVDYLSAMATHSVEAARDAGRARERADAAAADTRSLEQAVNRSVAAVRTAGARLQRAAAAQRRLLTRLERRLRRTIAMAIADRKAAEAAAAAAAAAAAVAAASDQTDQADHGPAPPDGPPLPQEQVHALILSLWGDGNDAVVAECVAARESGDIPTSRNPESGAAGLFQLMPFWWDGNNPYGWRFDPYDPVANAEHAHLLWMDEGWGPWTTGKLCV